MVLVVLFLSIQNIRIGFPGSRQVKKRVLNQVLKPNLRLSGVQGLQPQLIVVQASKREVSSGKNKWIGDRVGARLRSEREVTFEVKEKVTLLAFRSYHRRIETLACFW